MTATAAPPEVLPDETLAYLETLGALLLEAVGPGDNGTRMLRALGLVMLHMWGVDPDDPT